MNQGPLEFLRACTSLELPWPPTENNYKIPIRCGTFLKMALTKKARVFYTDVEEIIRRKFGAMKLVPYRGSVRVDIELRPPDRRRRDITNYDKCILDALTHCGVWTDDCLIDEIGIRRGQQFQGGRVIVLIAPLDVQPLPTQTTLDTEPEREF